MTDTDVRSSLGASSAVAVADRMPLGPRAVVGTITLTPEALEVAAKPAPSPISPIVLAGFVRMAEFALIVAVGVVLYTAYLPHAGLMWRYLGATLVISLLCTLAFQTADIYQVQAFRGYEKQYMRLASAWSVVFLIVIGVSFFAKAGDMFSRIWLGAYYIAGLIALIISRRFVFLLVRK
jgi:CoA-binding domain